MLCVEGRISSVYVHVVMNEQGNSVLACHPLPITCSSFPRPKASFILQEGSPNFKKILRLEKSTPCLYVCYVSSNHKREKIDAEERFDEHFGQASGAPNYLRILAKIEYLEHHLILQLPTLELRMSGHS